MPSLAILLLIIGAVLHTAWNLILKQSKDKYIATWWMLVTGGVVALVALFFTGLPPREMWKFAIFSVITEAAYFITLSYAYHDNEFSLVYPVARGSAPAFLALWSFVFLHEQLTSGGLIGLGMIIGGLFIIGISTLLQSHVSHLHFKGIAIALFIALLISIYTTIDGAAVRHGAAYALPYVMTMFALVPLPVTPFILREYGWSRLKEEWNKLGLLLSITGLLGVLSYLVAVFAFAIAPLSYSGAVREVSVVFGAFAGWWLLKEKLGGMRVLGAIVIFAGILVIALFG
ncbi:MAG: EamA family transporter [Anaerolineae bacterium]|nr:EamA family transporter [Anaerolineae bacterium]MCI0607685.1 EamA family transporter [Anaerolineae bacterium]